MCQKHKIAFLCEPLIDYSHIFNILPVFFLTGDGRTLDHKYKFIDHKRIKLCLPPCWNFNEYSWVSSMWSIVLQQEGIN